VYFHECNGCGARLKPLPGDCCVFCSYGTVPCPPIQIGRLLQVTKPLIDWKSSPRPLLGCGPWSGSRSCNLRKNPGRGWECKTPDQGFWTEPAPSLSISVDGRSPEASLLLF
jgi:hypothetical protein